MITDLPKIITYEKITPFDGKSITVCENDNLSAFEIKRFYWINYHTPESTFSEHAHKSLQQIIIAIEGKVNIFLESLSGETYHFTLDDSNKGLYIPPMLWKKIEYINPCVLLCLASENYDENDYIRNYEVFKKN